MNKTYEVYKKIRKTWDINPKTRIKDSDKKYNRNISKKELRRILQEEDF